MLRQKGVGISPYSVESDITKIKQAGQSDDNIKPPAEHDIGQDQRCDIKPVAQGKASIEFVIEIKQKQWHSESQSE